MTRRNDQGFSLVEILVNVVILGLFALGLASMFSVVVRTLPTAGDRADDTRALNGLGVWFREDMSSTPARIDDGSGTGGIDISSDAPSGCAGEQPGTNVIRLRWTETIGDTETSFLAAYRLVGTDDGGRIVRLACTDAGPASTRVMSDGLGGAACTSGDPTPSAVGSTVASADGTITGASIAVTIGCRQVAVEGTSRNRAEGLPPPQTAPLPVASTDASTTTSVAPQPSTTAGPGGDDSATTTTTTSTTTTTTPPCDAAVITSVSPPRVNNGSRQDMSELQRDVQITVTWTGHCVGLGVLVDPRHSDGSGIDEPKWFSLQGGTTLVLRGRGGEVWSDGIHSLRLKDGANSTAVLDTELLEVT